MNNYIEINNISFAYNKNNKNILENLSLSLKKERIIALLGKNGCGKSTLIDCLIGFNVIKSGSISISGININELKNKDLSTLISFVPQSTYINLDYKIRDFISFGRNPYVSFGKSPNKIDMEKVEVFSKKCGIENILDKNINKVSGGERQMAFIARALCQESDIIILDEPTASLDFGNQQKLFKLLKELNKQGKTIIFTTHNPNHLIDLDCDIYVIQDKKAFKINKIDDEILEKIYGVKFIKNKGYIFN